MRTSRNPLIMTLTGILVVCGMAACDPGLEETADSGSGGNGGGDVTTEQYIGPGSTWFLDLEDDGDFTLTERSAPERDGGTLLSSADGDYERLSSGFSRFTTVSIQGANPPAQDSELGALVIDDHLMLLRSWDGSNRLVPFIPDDDCPTQRFAGNWIQLIKPATDFATSTESAFFGNVQYSAGGTTLEVNNRYALTADYPELEDMEPLETGECEAGVASADNITTYFAANGTALIHRNAGTRDESLWLALPQTSLSNAVLDGTYIGYWIDYGSAANDIVWTVTTNCADFKCPVKRISDIRDLTSVVPNQVFDIVLDGEALDKPLSGFVTGTTVTPSGFGSIQASLACSANENFNNTGNKVLICVGQSPSNLQTTVNGFLIALD